MTNADVFSAFLFVALICKDTIAFAHGRYIPRTPIFLYKLTLLLAFAAIYSNPPRVVIVARRTELDCRGCIPKFVKLGRKVKIQECRGSCQQCPAPNPSVTGI